MSLDPIASRLAARGVAFAPEIASAARRHGLDPELLAAVAAQETGGPGSNAGRNIVGRRRPRPRALSDRRPLARLRPTPDAMDPGRKRRLRRRDDLGACSSGTAATSTRRSLPITPARRRRPGRRRAGPTERTSATPTRSCGTTSSSTERVARSLRRSPRSHATIASVGALQSQAQRLPMPPLPSPRHAQTRSSAASYHRQATDYLGFLNDADETNS